MKIGSLRSRRENLQKTLALIRQEDVAENSDDEQNDFDNAEIEEVEDNLMEARNNKNDALDEEEVNEIARNINPNNLSMSVLKYIYADSDKVLRKNLGRNNTEGGKFSFKDYMDANQTYIPD